MSSSSKYYQDMPPPGGYAAINTDKIFNKSKIRGKTIYLAYTAILTLGLAMHTYLKRKDVYLKMEQDGSFRAIAPFLDAEMKRQLLRTERKNMEIENKLMRNEPGWEMGTYFGLPLYYTAKPDDYYYPTYYEYLNYAHFRDIHQLIKFNKYKGF
ncbi:NADH dehydrogenase [ubiquinone] 1 alpha subcomplex subunit 13 isoform X2 [Prorops nasuta]|uniref:NADH dehydrogenase [ubiquinone] 1 alpha subcomplex subunit 13 isoform X2 n=1 Tax=Prorops nasuta TaxID=863751 RepID=UPI0034CEFB82